MTLSVFQMIHFYGSPVSSNCRSISLVMEALEIPHEYHLIDVRNEEEITGEKYKAINPRGTIPFVKDGDFVSTETSVILIHLVNSYGNQTNLYPKDVRIRAKIDNCLTFESDILYPPFKAILKDVFQGQSKFSDDHITTLDDGLKAADEYVKDSGFMAGTEYPTVADYSFLPKYSSFKSLDKILPINFAKYSELNLWMEKMKLESRNYEEANGIGVTLYKEWVMTKM